MPITTAAKKKLRQDAKRQVLNLKVKNAVNSSVKKFKKNKTAKLLSEAYSAIDTAVKKNIFHKNKAARMKSSLAKMMGNKKVKAESKTKSAKKILKTRTAKAPKK